jgi:hypothetical protein
MKKKSLTVFFLSLFRVLVFAQDTPPTSLAPIAIPTGVMKDTCYWKTSLKTGLILNQASFSNNWKGGGVNSIAYQAFLGATADYAKENLSFNSIVDFKFGAINNKNTGFVKNIDRIYADTKLGYAIAKNWSMFASVNFLTQFYDGFLTTKRLNRDTTVYVSNFMAPGYLTEALGFEYKPTNYFFLRFSPGAFRQTIVTAKSIDPIETKYYGVEVVNGKTIRNEIALLQIMAAYNKDIHKNINLKWQYIGFANYELPKETKENTNITWFDNIDHRFDATFTAKITKYITTTITTTLIYDYDQDPDVQFAQSLGLGIQFTY